VVRTKLLIYIHYHADSNYTFTSLSYFMGVTSQKYSIFSANCQHLGQE